MRVVEAGGGTIALAQEMRRSRLALTNTIFRSSTSSVISPTPPRAHELRFLRELLRRELGDVRAFITQLRPPLLASSVWTGQSRTPSNTCGR